MVISEKLNSLKYGNFGVFFPQKILYETLDYYFYVTEWQKFTQKTLDYMPTKSLLLTVYSLLF
jgi:hypothetical protein